MRAVCHTDHGVIATIVFGPSQVGKSSLIRLLRRQHHQDNDNDYDKDDPAGPVVGVGDGRSMTRSTQVFATGELGLMVDTGGWNDSELRFTSQEMAFQVSLDLATRGIEQVRFLVFDSLSGDTMQLRQTTVELVKSFGEAAKGSIVVVASKLDRAEPDVLEDRLRNMRRTMHDLGIGDRLVCWQNKGLVSAESTFEEQLCVLLECIDSTPAVATERLQSIHARIQKRAEELCNKQVPETQMVEYTVEETFLEERKEVEPCEEKYWETEYITKSRMDQEMEHAPVPAVISYIASLGLYAAVSANHKVKVPVQVEKTRTVEKLQTYYDEKTRSVDKWKQVPLPPKPVDSFLAQAREEIALEIRQAHANVV